jgi:hypothetical protein
MPTKHKQTNMVSIWTLFPLKMFSAKLWSGLVVYTMTSQWRRGGGGDRCSKVLHGLLTAEALWVRSDVIRIIFSLLMSSFIGGPIGPPAVGKKVVRTPWGRGVKLRLHGTWDTFYTVASPQHKYEMRSGRVVGASFCQCRRNMSGGRWSSVEYST